MNSKAYIAPKMTLLVLATADIITASIGNNGENEGDGEGLF